MKNDPLDQLRDVHLPDVPAWWPPAPGWWITAGLGLLLLALLIRQISRWRRRTRPRRLALAELEAQLTGWRTGRLGAAECLNGCNALLKRLWVHVEGRHDLAGLSGNAWLSYLDTRSRTNSFTEGPGRLLGDQRFSADLGEADLKPLQPLLKRLLQSTSGAP